MSALKLTTSLKTAVVQLFVLTSSKVARASLQIHSAPITFSRMHDPK